MHRCSSATHNTCAAAHLPPGLTCRSLNGQCDQTRRTGRRKRKGEERRRKRGREEWGRKKGGEGEKEGRKDGEGRERKRRRERGDGRGVEGGVGKGTAGQREGQCSLLSFILFGRSFAVRFAMWPILEIFDCLSVSRLPTRFPLPLCTSRFVASIYLIPYFPPCLATCPVSSRTHARDPAPPSPSQSRTCTHRMCTCDPTLCAPFGTQCTLTAIPGRQGLDSGGL